MRAGLHARGWAAGCTRARGNGLRYAQGSGLGRARPSECWRARHCALGRDARCGGGAGLEWWGKGRARAEPRWAGARGKWERRAGRRARAGSAAGPRRGGARDGLVGQNGRAAQEGEEGLFRLARGREGWAFSFSLLFPLSSLLSFISFPSLHLNLGLVLIQIQPRSRF
jgi:hypothetical protein